MRASPEFIQNAIDAVEELGSEDSGLQNPKFLSRWMAMCGRPIVEQFIQEYKNSHPENEEMPMPKVVSTMGSPFCGQYSDELNHILLDVGNAAAGIEEIMAFEGPEGMDPEIWKQRLRLYAAAAIVSVLIHESIHAIQLYSGRNRKSVMELDQDLYPYQLRLIEVCAHACCRAMMWAVIAPRKVYRTRRLGDLSLYIYRQNLTHMVSDAHPMRLFLPHVSDPFRKVLTQQLSENLKSDGYPKSTDAVQGMVQDRRDLFDRQYRRYAGWWQPLNERCHSMFDRT